MAQQVPNPGAPIVNSMGNQMQINNLNPQGQQMGQMNNMVSMNMNPAMQQNQMNVNAQ